MYQRILAPVSRGSAFECGVREAIRLARAPGASLRFIHVVGRSSSGRNRAGFSDSVGDYLALLETLDRQCSDIVSGLHRLAGPAGVEFEIVLRSTADGAPCDQVVSEARDWRADVIVMGVEPARGARLRPGGQGACIVQSSPVAVMVFSPREYQS